MWAIFEGIEDLLKKASEFNDCSRDLVTLASAVGVLVLFYYALSLTFKLIHALRLYFISQYCCKVNFVEKYGQWAVISGATDGIGQAMAKELAGRGMSIIVVSRNEEKLAKTKTMLEQVPNVGQVETVRIDLSDPSLANFDRIRALIDPDNRDIGMLINNAGTFPDKFARFNRYEMDEIVSMVNLNVLAMLHLTRMIMPGMIDRGKGMVVNISSILGAVPGPYISVYSPTKSFVNSFTHQLQMEYDSHPIDIVLLQPGQVRTNIVLRTAKMTKPSLILPTPEEYAQSAINTLSARPKSLAGYFLHEIFLSQMVLVDKLGLLGMMLKTMLKLNGKNVHISPLMKRKQVRVQEPSSSTAAGASNACPLNQSDHQTYPQ